MPEKSPSLEQRLTSNAQWMERLGDAIASCPLNELALPGAHRAGSATVPTGPGNVADAVSRCLRCAELLAPDSVAGWLRAQDMGILQLLDAGVRYLDLCVSADDQGQVRVGYPGRGRLAGSVMAEIRSFIERQPREIVVLHFRELHGFETGVYQDFAERIVHGFKDLLAVPDERGARVPVGELWDRGSRVIVAYPDVIHQRDTACSLCERPLDSGGGTKVSLRKDLRAAIWPRHLVRAEESGATTLAALKSFLAAEPRERGSEQLLVLNATLRPNWQIVAAGQIGRSVMYFKDSEDQLARCLPGFLREAIPRFWRDCFPGVLADAQLTPTRLSTIGRDTVTPEVIEWLRHDWAALPLNIVSVDGIDGSGLVELLCQRNEAAAQVT